MKKPILKSAFKLAAITGIVGINAVTLTNQWIIAHYDTQEHPENVTSNALAGTLLAPTNTASDWTYASTPGKQFYNGETPIKVIANNTPDTLQIPGAIVFTVLGAPGACIGNLGGTTSGYISSDNQQTGTKATKPRQFFP